MGQLNKQIMCTGVASLTTDKALHTQAVYVHTYTHSMQTLTLG